MKIKAACFFLLIGLNACQKPAQNSTSDVALKTESVNNSGSCSGTYYFYNREKVALTILPKYITVAFTDATNPEEKTRFLNSFPAFSKIVSENRNEAGEFQVVELKPNQTCEGAKKLAADLQKSPAVLFANPVFAAPASMGNDYNWIGVTSEFLVTIKSSDDAGDFKNLMTETNTRIIDKLSETSFTLLADKNAKGNALEMANLFSQQTWVESAEPNFHMSNKQDLGTERK